MFKPQEDINAINTPPSSSYQKYSPAQIASIVTLLGASLMATIGCSKESSNQTPPSPITKVQPSTTPKKKPSQINKPTPDVSKELAVYGPMKQKWMNELSKLGKIDVHAQAIHDFLKENAILGAPVAQGLKFIEQGKTPTWVGLTFVTEDDTKNPTWEHYSTKNLVSSAHYLPDKRTIIMKNDAPVSDSWKGILLAHEGLHAKEMVTAPYDWEDPETFDEHEVGAHTFQNSLMTKIGGDRYQKALEEEIKRSREVIKKTGPGAFEKYFPARQEYSPAFDEVFGPCESQFERDTRGTQIWIHALFKMIDQDFPNKEDRLRIKKITYRSITAKNKK